MGEIDDSGLRAFDKLMERKIGELQIPRRKEIKWLPKVEIVKSVTDAPGYRLYAHAVIGDFEFISEAKDFPNRQPVGDNPTPEEWKILSEGWQREFEEKALLYINDRATKDVWATLVNKTQSKAEFDLDKLIRMILETKKESAKIHLIIPPAQLENILIEIVKGLRLQEEVFQLLNYRLDLYEDRIKNLEATHMPLWRKLLDGFRKGDRG